MRALCFCTLLLSCKVAALQLYPMPCTRCASPVMMGSSAQQDAKQAWQIKHTEDAATQAWLVRLDADMWTNAVTTVSAQVMSEGKEGAAAKQAWLARLSAPMWCAVAAAVAEVAASVQLQEPSERAAREAKRAWLARLDAPSWLLGAATLVEVAGSALAIEALQMECDLSQDAAACDVLLKEQEARRAWLGALDAPTWAAVSTTVATVAVEVTLQAPAGMLADEIARAEWLVQLETASWARPQSQSLREMDLRGQMSEEEAAIRAQMNPE